VSKGFQGPALREIRERKKKEEKNEVEALPITSAASSLKKKD